MTIIFMFLGGLSFVLLYQVLLRNTKAFQIAALMNIGPRFGMIGPTENYAFISDTGKWFLSWNMLVGRLERFSALVVLYPSFWEK